VVTDLATKRQLSASEAYRRQTLSLDETARAQDKIARATKVADDALRQGLITQAEHARRLTLITQKYMEGVGGSSAFRRALLVATDNAQAFAGRLGSVGQVLTAIGPAGLAVAAAIGAVAVGMKAAADASLALAERAGRLRDLSDTVGLTVTQIQAL